MEPQKSPAGGIGFDRFCTYRIYHSIYQKTDFWFFGNQYGKGGILENSPLPFACTAPLSGHSFDVGVCIWSVYFLLGKGKAVFEKDNRKREKLQTQTQINCSLDRCRSDLKLKKKNEYLPPPILLFRFAG